jgi:medium-chain acyl-[acyl-carrier-protein] hydrolase
MAEKLILNTTVAYGDVDRREVMLLPRIFKLLQEVAIEHANQFGTGTNAVAARAETWVLNRITVAIDRYPRHGEALRAETWSSGIKGFKGFRDFRVYDGAERPIISASSLWLYISLATKTIVRVPREVAENFPVCAEPAWCPDIERLAFDPPSANATSVPVSLRYSDFDVNEHVNNAAYLDFVQTALAASGREACPRRVQLKYTKGITVETERATVRLEPVGNERVRFGIENDGVVFAAGEASG